MLQSKCDHQTRHTILRLVNGYVFVCYVAVFWGLSKLVKKNWTGDGHWAGLNLEELTTFEYQIITKRVRSDVKRASMATLLPTRHLQHWRPPPDCDSTSTCAAHWRRVAILFQLFRIARPVSGSVSDGDQEVRYYYKLKICKVYVAWKFAELWPLFISTDKFFLHIFSTHFFQTQDTNLTLGGPKNPYLL